MWIIDMVVNIINARIRPISNPYCIASMMINIIGAFLIPKNRKKVISIEG